MKTTASNGTVLELGRKYTYKGWNEKSFFEILSIGKKQIFIKDKREEEYSIDIESDIIPYKEPQPKPFEKYQKWYGFNKAHNFIQVCYSELKPKDIVLINVNWYSEGEVKELGLKID